MHKLAIVTGGSRGIGASISIALKASGFKVVANYLSNSSNAEKFAKDNDITVKKWNVADYDESINAVAEIEKENNMNVSILVNNAGIIKDVMMHKMSFHDWQSVIDVNLTSCFNMCRAVINQMRNQSYGRIVNISSINAQAGQLGQTNYCATKAGIIGLTKALALESASKNITVNAIAPGYIHTDMLSGISDEIKNKIISYIPMKRLGTAEDIARAVLFLIDDKAGFITGETISVNGGHYMK